MRDDVRGSAALLVLLFGVNATARVCFESGGFPLGERTQRNFNPFAQFVDLDLDNTAELVSFDIGDDGTGYLQVRSSLGGGAFASPVEYYAGVEVQLFSWDVGDLDGDNAPDVAYAFADTFGGRTAAFRNLGNGTFAPFTPIRDFTGALRIAEVDGGVGPDLVTFVWVDANTKLLRVLPNLGGLTFGVAVDTPVVNTAEAYRLTVADLDGNGFGDVVLEADAAVHSYLSDGSGQFPSSVATVLQNPARAIAIGDLYAGVEPDLAVLSDGAVDLYEGVGTGAFVHRQSFTLLNGGRDVVIGDLDGVGRAEVVVAEASGLEVFDVTGGRVFDGLLDRSFFFGLSIGYADAGTEPDLVVTDMPSPSGQATLHVLLSCGNGNLDLLRDASIASLDPMTYDLATLLPLDAGDIYQARVAPGDRDLEDVRHDAGRPLIFYALDDPAAVLKLVTTTTSVAVQY